MKIVVVSNVYPPYHVGGYELGCRDVVDGLKVRGHQIKVLTSTYGINRKLVQDDVHRILTFVCERKNKSRTRHVVESFSHDFTNQRSLLRVCRSFNPDLIYFWNMAHLPLSLLFVPKKLGVPACYFVSDDWILRWQSDAWYTEIQRPHRAAIWRGLFALYTATRTIVPCGNLEFENVQFASAYLRQVALKAGQNVTSSEVIHWGVNLDRFTKRGCRQCRGRLLYVGQLVPHKGVHTAIEAVNILVNQRGCREIVLTVVGKGTSQYETQLRDWVKAYNLDVNIRFTGFLAREELPSVYKNNDILIFPSIWDEPFSIALLEAMASGLAVVGTSTGGTGEILKDECNGLVFPAGDAEACSAQIFRVLQTPELYEKVRCAGRLSLEVAFDIDQTINLIEESLREIVAAPLPNRALTLGSDVT